MTVIRNPPSSVERFAVYLQMWPKEVVAPGDVLRLAIAGGRVGPCVRSATVRADPDDVFDTERFVADVVGYRKRRRHTLSDLTDLTGLPISAVCATFNRDVCPTLNTIIRLAVYADLDLNAYVKVTVSDLVAA